MNKFKELGICDDILKSIEKQRFTEPTEIQEKSIPAVLEGKDVVAGSATGSGKTLAFGVGIIQNTERKGGIQALVLAPTRELAQQITDALRDFSHHKKLKIVEVYGGVSINPQMDDLRHADIVVGTPGRILDHMDRGTIDFSRVKTFVLDEADLMVDMGFIDDVRKIMSACPPERQSLMFSATITPDIDYIIKKYMNDPVRVSAENAVDPTKLKQIYYDVRDNAKFSLLVHLLQSEQEGLVMVFCNTRQNTDFVAANLKANKIQAQAIHGGLTQAKRGQIMTNFHKQKVYVLVATNVAARGLDIKGVSHVYNYDIPKESKEYIHRIGRTARAGKEGMAISVLSPRDHENFDRVLRDTDINVELEPLPKFERALIKHKDPPRGESYGRGFGGDRRGGDRRGGSRGGSRGGDRRDGPRRSSY